jgi:diguanylate cyclase (GGDEF)-like protein
VEDRFNTREQLLAEVGELRRSLNEAKERCERDEEALQAIEQRNRLLGDSTPLGVFTTDVQGRITGFNRKMTQMMPSLSRQDGTPSPLFKFQPLVDVGFVRDFRHCVEKKASAVKEYPCVTSQGGCMHLRFNLSPVLDDAGEVSGVLVFVEDITNLKLAEVAIREGEERYRLLFQSTPIALIERDASQLNIYLDYLRASGVTDFSGYLLENPQEVAHCVSMIKTVDYNDAMLKLMEARNGDELNGSLSPAHFDDFQRMARESILMVAERNISGEREGTLMTLKGNKRNVLLKSLIVSGHEDTLARIVVSLVDISRRKQAEEALRASEQRFRRQAMQDNLTGLYNRRYLYRSLSDWIQVNKVTKIPLSLIFMDIDEFKRVVDTHGHLNGSQAIQEVAATIRDSIKEPAYAVAYAGDEFVVVLPGLNQAEAVKEASIIMDRMKNFVYLQSQGLAVRLQASFGVATFPDHATDVTELLASADKALFAVKRNGKNAIAPYN